MIRRFSALMDGFSPGVWRFGKNGEFVVVFIKGIVAFWVQDDFG